MAAADADARNTARCEFGGRAGLGSANRFSVVLRHPMGLSVFQT